VEFETPADSDYLNQTLLEHRNERAALISLNAEAKKSGKEFRFAEEDDGFSDWRLVSSDGNSFSLVEKA
jgi:hypothetical protein